MKLVLFTTRGLNKAVDVEVRMLTYASPHHIQLLADLFASVSQLRISSGCKILISPAYCKKLHIKLHVINAVHTNHMSDTSMKNLLESTSVMDFVTI